MGIIYLGINKINGGLYVGKTIQIFERRLRRHKIDSKKENTYIYRAVRKYGWDSFSWIIIDEVPDNELNELEKEYIAYYRMIGKHLYNISDGGDGFSFGNKYGSYKHTIQHNKKISETLNGNTRGLEFKKSIEFRNKKALQYSNGKLYTIIDSDGLVYEHIINLSTFCKEHSLKQSMMRRVVIGKRSHHKQWKGFIE